MEMNDFIESCKHLYFNISDFKKLKIGDTIDVVLWDRNFEEYEIWDSLKPNKKYNVERFFKENRAQITYKGDLKWDIDFAFGEKFTHPIHLNTKHLKTNWTWVPVKNKMVTIKSEIVDRGKKIPKSWKPINMHWEEFPEKTYVGWRGPIMLWKYLKNVPKIYWLKNKL
jgi:hypothetical protein